MNLPVIHCFDCKGAFTAEIDQKAKCPGCGKTFLVMKDGENLTVVRA